MQPLETRLSCFVADLGLTDSQRSFAKTCKIDVNNE